MGKPVGPFSSILPQGRIRSGRVSQSGSATTLVPTTTSPPTSLPSSSPLANLWLGHLGTHSLGWSPELLAGIWGAVIRGRSWARDTGGGGVYSDSSLGPELAAKPHIPNGRGAVGKEGHGWGWVRSRIEI